MVFFSEMPRTYIRKSNRGSWAESDLQKALKAVNDGEQTVYKASKIFNIPERTLRRRLLKDDDKKRGLGPKGVLGVEIEQKLAVHIKKLQAAAFCPTVTEVRILAYKLAERYNLKHSFNKEKMIAGYDWFYKFLQRNPDISVRKAEGLSLARAQGLTREDADAYFNLLKTILLDNGLMDKPANIYNVDETGLPLNNKPGYVLAAKGSKDVHKVTSGEKGENFTAIVCCNAEGNFLPPVCILKGVNKKAEWEDKMPPGSYIVMSRQSSYVNTEIFSDWIENQFIPRKAQGKCLLILDGHTSHTSADKLLDLAAKNDIILLCLPSHSTHFLQPLDRCFFKSLKHYWFQACQRWFDAHSFPGNPRKLGRAQVGELLTSAWKESATAQNGIAGFEATGIYPFNPKAIPSRAFVGSNVDFQSEPNFFKQKSTSSNKESTALRPITPGPSSNQTPDLSQPSTSKQSCSFSNVYPTLKSTSSNKESARPQISGPPGNQTADFSQPSTSKQSCSFSKVCPTLSDTTCPKEGNNPTPTKVLNNISPVPSYEKRKPNKRRQNAQELTSSNVIAEKRKKRLEKQVKEENKNKAKGKQYAERNRKLSKSKSVKPSANYKKKLFGNPRNQKEETSTEEEFDESDIPYQESDGGEDFLQVNENECSECLEDYKETSEKCDWIKCIVCSSWLHEACSKFLNKCAVCGRAEILIKRKKEHLKTLKK